MNKKKFFLSLIVTILILGFVSVGIGLFSSDIDMRDALDRTNNSRLNILVAGVDKDGLRSDVNMLFSLDTDKKTIQLLSIPRDTRVQYKKGYHGKINACIGKEDGEELLIQTVKDLTGLPVHNFCKVDFQGLRDIIDILGGVEFDVPMNMDYDDPVQDLHIHIKKGKQVLNGAEAEGLLRYRKGYATGDLGRIDMQQAFIKEAVRQKLRFKYILKAIPVARSISESVETDMSVMHMLKYAWKLRSSKLELNTHVLPGAPKTIGGASYYICDENATKRLVRTEFGYEDGKDISGEDNALSEKTID